MTAFAARLASEPLASTLLDSLPCPVLILDEALGLVVANGPARRWFEEEGGEVAPGARPGDLLACAQAAASPEGCGEHPDCRRCLLRRGGREALAGHSVQQREVRLRRDTEEVSFLLSASPLRFEGRILAVVVLQELTRLHRLTSLLPICASCKRIRREDQSWVEVEEVLSRDAGRDLTHSICPRCIEERYPEYSDRTGPAAG